MFLNYYILHTFPRECSNYTCWKLSKICFQLVKFKDDSTWLRKSEKNLRFRTNHQFWLRWKLQTFKHRFWGKTFQTYKCLLHNNFLTNIPILKASTLDYNIQTKLDAPRWYKLRTRKKKIETNFCIMFVSFVFIKATLLTIIIMIIVIGNNYTEDDSMFIKALIDNYFNIFITNPVSFLRIL